MSNQNSGFNVDDEPPNVAIPRIFKHFYQTQKSQGDTYLIDLLIKYCEAISEPEREDVRTLDDEPQHDESRD